MKLYEITNDHGIARVFSTSDSKTEYVITSSYGHDLVDEFTEKHGRRPSARWYQRNFRFKR